jgi:hypothetical protein
VGHACFLASSILLLKIHGFAGFLKACFWTVFGHPANRILARAIQCQRKCGPFLLQAPRFKHVTVAESGDATASRRPRRC